MERLNYAGIALSVCLALACLFSFSAHLKYKTQEKSYSLAVQTIEGHIDSVFDLLPQRTMPPLTSVKRALENIGLVELHLNNLVITSSEAHKVQAAEAVYKEPIQRLKDAVVSVQKHLNIYLKNSQSGRSIEGEIEPINNQLEQLKKAQFGSRLTEHDYLERLDQLLSQVLALETLYDRASSLGPETQAFVHKNFAEGIRSFASSADEQQVNPELMLDPRHRSRLQQINNQINRLIQKNPVFFTKTADPKASLDAVDKLHELAPMASKVQKYILSLKPTENIWAKPQLLVILVVGLLLSTGFHGYRLGRHFSLPDKQAAAQSKEEANRLRQKILMAQISQDSYSDKTQILPTETVPLPAQEPRDHNSTVVLAPSIEKSQK